MDVKKLSLPGLIQLTPRLFSDARGYFIETYNETAKPFVWTKPKVHQKRLRTRFADQ